MQLSKIYMQILLLMSDTATFLIMADYYSTGTETYDIIVMSGTFGTTGDPTMPMVADWQANGTILTLTYTDHDMSEAATLSNGPAVSPNGLTGWKLEAIDHTVYINIPPGSIIASGGTAAVIQLPFSLHYWDVASTGMGWTTSDFDNYNPNSGNPGSLLQTGWSTSYDPTTPSIGGAAHDMGSISYTLPGSASTGDGAMLSHRVRLLGFSLHDLKVPAHIAKQVQGFRIYRAKRSHENKTILGQSLLLPMALAEHNNFFGKRRNIDDEHHDQKIPHTKQSLLYAVPTYREYFFNFPTAAYNGWKNWRYFTFYDFNLLRTQASIAGATHIKNVGRMKMLSMPGPNLYNHQTRCGHHHAEPINNYRRNMNVSVFHTLEDYEYFSARVGDPSSTSVTREAGNFMLHSNAKIYLQPGLFTGALASGFSADMINNINGETSIALGVSGDKPMRLIRSMKGNAISSCDVDASGVLNSIGVPDYDNFGDCGIFGISFLNMWMPGHQWVSSTVYTLVSSLTPPSPTGAGFYPSDYVPSYWEVQPYGQEDHFADKKYMF